MSTRPQTRSLARGKKESQKIVENDPRESESQKMFENDLRELEVEQRTEKSSLKSKLSKTNSEASIVIAKKKAELAAAKKMLALEKKLIEKELELEIAELSAKSNRSEKSYITISCKNKRTEEWLKKQKNETFDDQQNFFPSNTYKIDDEFINVSENKKDKKLSDIQILAKEIKDLRRPAERDLPIFYGNPSEWIAFKAAYNRTKAFISEDEDIARLHRCLRGDARETVASLLQIYAPALEIIRTLELRYGRPELILFKEINALKELPRLNDSSELLNKFAAKVRNCVTTMLSLNRPDQLYNTELIQSLKTKMSYLKSRWLTYAIEHELENEPELVKISNFLHHEAISVTKHWIPEPIKFTNHSKPSTSYRTHCLEDFIEESNHELNIEESCCPTFDKSHIVTKETLKCPCCDSAGHKSVKECNKFKLLTINDRWNWAKDNKFCFKCLNFKHRRENCRAKPCGVNGCRMSHNRLLHATSNPSTITQNSEPVENQKINVNETSCPSTTEITTSNKRESRSILQMIPVTVYGPAGSCQTFALLDGGSTITLLTKKIADKIGAIGEIEPLTLSGVNATTTDPTSIRIDIQITGPSNEVVNLFGARTVKHLSLHPQTAKNLDKYRHLRDLPLDKLTYENAVPEILIGQDNWHAIIAKEVRSTNKNEPVASLTALGWVIHGTIKCIADSVNYVGHASDDDLHNLIEEYFQIESIGVKYCKKMQSIEDEKAIEILSRTAKRIENGKRWEVGLLWRDDQTTMSSEESYLNAMKRLRHIERKMDRDPTYGQKYKENMENFMKSGYAEMCAPTDSPRRWYLPHFGVTNINKPGKLRIVYDAACKVLGSSLNDKLLTGPDLLLSILEILFKFREGKIAVSSDVKEMFLQIRIRPEDRPAQRFLWRGLDRIGSIKEYEMKSVIFGATSSPTTAIYILNRNAEDFVNQYPEAVEAIKTRFYMDDYLHSFHSEEEALKIIKDVSYINEEGGFVLTQWMSNNKQILNSIDVGKRGTGGVELNFNVTVKTLGLRWLPSDDTLGFNLTLSKIPSEILAGTKKPTKREMLKVVMSLFDPLGLLTPILIQGKILLQQIWRSGIDWDDKIKDIDLPSWNNWIRRLTKSYVSKIPRCYYTEALKTTIELHIFCDASEKAYAAVAYWRFITSQNKIYISIVASKSRVTPLKPVSIPRLELQAAVLGARLADTIIKQHDTIKPVKRFFWTDSSAVVYWIKRDPRNYKTFVSNRLGELAELTSPSEWHWLPTSMNVADDATREIDRLDATDRWFTGPAFLYRNPEKWPHDGSFNDVPKNLLEEKKVAHIVAVADCINYSLPDIQRFSKWLRLIRSTAYILLFLENTRNKTKCDLERRHLEAAENLWIKQSQFQTFSRELRQLNCNQPLDKSSYLYKVAPFVDQLGLLRLKGRATRATDIDTNLLEPIILHGKNDYTKLLIKHQHEITYHGNCETVVNQLRQKYWIIHLRPAVKFASRSCQDCKVRRAHPLKPPIGDLPLARLTHHRRPFTHCGLDYFGPLQISIGRRREKRYGALFTCLTTRAVHIELAGSLTTDSVILALRRMMSRRGCPNVIHSDNGTNFRGAAIELKTAIRSLETNKFKEYLVNKGVEWRFIPPGAPHMGGCWERLVRSVKRALHITLKEVAPSEEVLLTVLIEAEHTINSRPLTHVSINPQDEEALTPNHFLLGSSSGVPLPGSFQDSDLLGRKQWRKAQTLCDKFWNRWIKEYLPIILCRSTSGSIDDLKIDDIVILCDENMPRNVWPKGRIIRIFPGADGRVRVAEVQTARGHVFKRPASKLARIPVNKSDM